MKGRGFTLFTALLSFVLIVLSVLLVQSMIRGERNTTDIISDIREQEELQAIADLSRADAIQVFNFGIRFSIEDWITDPSNEYLYDPNASTWDAAIEDFATSYFGGGEGDSGVQFANRTAKHLTSILSTRQDYGNYKIDLESDEFKLRETLKSMFRNSIAKGNFFEVIGCDAGADGQIDFEECPVGTFYVNLDVSELTDQEYEGLPQIRVESLTTGRVLKEPILPRGNLRIYVPLRMFRVIAAAQDFANGRGDTTATGMWEYYDSVKNYALGICYPDNCNPTNRIDGPNASSPVLAGSHCPFDTVSSGNPPVNVTLQYNFSDQPAGGGTALFSWGQGWGHWKQEGEVDVGEIPPPLGSYNAASLDNMQDVLSALVTDKIEADITTIGNAMTAAAANAGMPEGEGYTLGVRPLDVTAVARDSHRIVNNLNSGVELYAKCTKIERIGMTIVYSELVDRYKVIADKDRAQTYKVRIIDNRYEGYTRKGNDTCYSRGTDSKSCSPAP